MASGKQAIVVPLIAALIGGSCALTGAWVGATWARTNTELTISSTRQQSVAETVRPVCVKLLKDLTSVKRLAESYTMRADDPTPSVLRRSADNALSLMSEISGDEVEWSLLTSDPELVKKSLEPVYQELSDVWFFFDNSARDGKLNYEGVDDALDPLRSESIAALGALEPRCRAEAELPPR